MVWQQLPSSVGSKYALHSTFLNRTQYNEIRKRRAAQVQVRDVNQSSGWNGIFLAAVSPKPAGTLNIFDTEKGLT